MYVKIHKPDKKYNKNHGSCIALAEYLDKENKELAFVDQQHFFNQDRNNISISDVVCSIDKNKTNLAFDETKFYMVTINPSERELKHICKQVSNRDIENISQFTASERIAYDKALQDYTRNVMDVYARNFNRNLTGNDILYYGKVEHIRTYKHDEVKLIEEREKHIKLTKSDLDNIVYSKTYYADLESQNIAHGLKTGDAGSISQAAKDLLSKIPDNAVLVPMPSSCGYATYTKDLSDEIRRLNPSLDVCDVLKCNSREKLYELKQKGFEADSGYFNFHLQGTLPKDRPVYFVDNTLSTGTTYVHAKEAIPEAKLAVHSINEDVSIKRAKLDQLSNLKNTDLHKAGDRKAGLQSHIHVIVSRKDIDNAIKISPLANAKNSTNLMPDGSSAQIGFNRQSFVQSSESAFDTMFSYNRQQQHSFKHYHIISKGLPNLAKQFSYHILPEELKPAHQAKRVYNTIERFSQTDVNIRLANKLSLHRATFNSLVASSDVLKVQATLFPHELKNSYSVFGPDHKQQFEQLNTGLSEKINERIEATKQFNSSIREAHSKSDFKTVRRLRSEKENFAAPIDKVIIEIKNRMHEFCIKNNLAVNADSLGASSFNAPAVDRFSEKFSEVSAQLAQIHSKTRFLESYQNSGSINLYQNLSALKAAQFDIYSATGKLGQLSKDLAAFKSELQSSLTRFRVICKIELAQAKTLGRPILNMTENHRLIEKNLFSQISTIGRAQSDIKFQTEKIYEAGRVITSCQRAVNPMDAYRSVLSFVPGAKEALHAVSVANKLQSALAASNPVSLAAEAFKLAGKKIIQAGMGI